MWVGTEAVQVAARVQRGAAAWVSGEEAEVFILALEKTLVFIYLSIKILQVSSFRYTAREEHRKFLKNFSPLNLK